MAASVAASPSMLSSRLKALVMPTSQTTASGTASQSRLDELDREAGGDGDRRRHDLGRELDERRQPHQVVDQPDDEEQRRAGEDAEKLRARLDGADGDGQGHAGEEAREDADAAERRSGPTVPPFAARLRDEAVAQVGSQEREERQRRDRQCGDRDCRAHERRG